MSMTMAQNTSSLVHPTFNLKRGRLAWGGATKAMCSVKYRVLYGELIVPLLMHAPFNTYGVHALLGIILWSSLTDCHLRP